MARSPSRAWLIGMLLALMAAPAPGQDLRIGMKAAIDGSDPHLSYSPNRNVQLHVYEALVAQDDHQRPIPGLASGWRLVDPATWEFTLRDGARFHDGTPVAAADVMFSLTRAREIKGIRTYGASLRSIVAMEPAGDRGIRIRTAGPTPMLPAYLTGIAIVSATAARDAGEAEFNGGRAALGTGPYRWVRFTPGADVVLERAATYQGPAEPWQRVTFRFIPNDSARAAALLAGDVDVVDAVPAALYGRLRDDERTRLVTTTSSFNHYLYYDHFRDRALYATGPDGAPLGRNPMRDRRVRQAISHAINRTALAERAMEGGAEPSGQVSPPGYVGYDPELAVPAYDPPLARRLLAEAGFPQGFGLTLHCTADRFAGDARTCQAVGQMLGAVGIRTAIETLPTAIFFRRGLGGAGGEPEFTASMSMFASTTGVAAEGMNAIVRSYDPVLGHGASNRGRYSDPVLDGLLGQVETTLDAPARDALMRQAVRRAMAEQAVTPVFFVKAAWGVRRGLGLAPRGDQYTMATGIRRQP